MENALGKLLDRSTDRKWSIFFAGVKYKVEEMLRVSKSDLFPLEVLSGVV